MLFDQKSDRTVSKPKFFFGKRKVAMIIVAATLVLGSFSSLYPWSSNSIDSVRMSRCGKTAPISPAFNMSIEKIFENSEFKEKAISRLSGAIQIPTEIYDNNPSPSDDLEYYNEFFKFHDYLTDTFPLVSKNLKLEKINQLNLLYTWEGKDKSLKPMMFAAHQDVVPVDKTSISQWKFSPFSGYYDEVTDSIWGRGAADCKTMLIAELAAIEQLIEDGFEPTRTVLVALGFDEETTGIQGARTMGQFLHARYEDDGIYSIVDEGTMVQKVSENVFIAAPVVQEKGYVDVNITVHGNGGHSSIPPQHTTIGVAADIVLTLENRPFEFDFSTDNPFYGFLVCMAEHSDKLPVDFKRAILKAPYDDNEKEKLVKLISDRPEMRELIRTSQAVDIFNGGMKANALPQTSTFLINHRIDILSSVQEVLQKDLRAAREVAEKYGYGLYLGEKEIIPISKLGYIEVNHNNPLEPSPYSPTKGSKIWDLFCGTIQNVYQEGFFKNNSEVEVYVTTNTISANGDTKYYWPLTKNIYRFFGNIQPPNLFSTVHSVDENIPASAHLTSIAFIYEYIVNVQERALEDEMM